MSLFGFGKRVTAPGPSPAPLPARAVDRPQKVLPDEIWDGELGTILREIGVTPQDEQNRAPTPDAIAARLARDKAAHQARWAEVNADIAARTGGGAVLPLLLIPEACWNSEAGTFLLAKLNLSPYQDWNVAFLPADKRTADALNLPMHPGEDDPEIVTYGMGAVSAAIDQYQAYGDEVDRTGDLGLFNERIEDITDKIRGLAVRILAQHEEAWRREHV